MLTIIASAVVLAAVAAGDYILWRYMRRTITARLDAAKAEILDEALKRGKASAETLVAEVQGILDAAAKDTEGLLEESAQQQSKAIAAVIAGQSSVNKDHKARIEELLELTSLHSKILRFDMADVAGGASTAAMQKRPPSDKSNPAAGSEYGDFRGDSGLL